MKIVQKPTDELIPYRKNAKRHSPEQVKNVAESIRRFGLVQPVVVDKKGVIVIGHCRVLACKKLGIKSVPCVCVSDLTDEQVKALRIVDNKTNESPWDMGFLKEELKGIDVAGGFDFDFGLKDFDFSKEPPEIEEKEISPFKKCHFLISCDIDSYEDVKKRISCLDEIAGVEIDRSLN